MVYIYAVDIENLPDPLESPEIMEKLAEDRKEKIIKCKQLQSRKQSLGAGLLLSYVLDERGMSDSQVRYGSNGKPEIDGIFLNLSHSKNLVICAVGKKPVGCDVEQIVTAPEKVAERFFAENELEYLRGISEEKKSQEFYRLWTIKESYIKMTGEGLRVPLDKFEVNFQDRIGVYREGERQSCFVKEYEISQDKDTIYQISVCAEESETLEQVILKKWEELVDKN